MIEHDPSYKNMEISRSGIINEEVTEIDSLASMKVSFASECMDQMTFRYDIPMNKVGLEFIKGKELTIQEKNSSYGIEMIDKTETNDVKNEIEIEEHELSNEQLKCIKTEGYEVKHNSEYVENTDTLLSKYDFDYEQYVNDIETVKRERDVQIGNISVGNEVDMEKQNTVQQYHHNYSKYETGDVERQCDHKTNIEQHQSMLPIQKVEDKSILQTQPRSAHKDNVKYFKCQFCEFITSRLSCLKLHFTRKHSENPKLYQCYNCKYQTKVKNYLVTHCRAMHNENTEWYQCHLCDFKTKYKSSLWHHRRKHDDSAEIFLCEVCSFKSKYKTTLLKHHRSKHDDSAKSFRCELCSFKTNSKYRLLSHSRSKHDGAAEIFQCELCDFKTKHRQSFLQHHKSKHDAPAEIFRCEVCDFKTKFKSNLLRHHRLKHDHAAKILLCETQLVAKNRSLNTGI